MQLDGELILNKASVIYLFLLVQQTSEKARKKGDNAVFITVESLFSLSIEKGNVFLIIFYIYMRYAVLSPSILSRRLWV